MDYTQQKLWEAVNALVGGSGTVQERLTFAAQYLAVLVARTQPAFPNQPDLQQRFDDVYHDLTRSKGIQAVTRELTNEEGREIAEEIFALFCRATDLADTPVGFEPRRGRGV